MKFVKLTLIAALFVMGAAFMSPALVRAQEGEPVVVDEVIAQVNDGIVTLSQLKREMAERVQTSVEVRRIVPERRVARVLHHVYLRVRQARLVLVDDPGEDDCVGVAVRDQHGLADLRQQIVVVEGA